jgi:hypothetical protein
MVWYGAVFFYLLSVYEYVWNETTRKAVYR